MPRDELKQPLKKRSLGTRLWQSRPSALVSAYALVLMSFAASGTWLLRQPMPFAGEPMVSLAIPVVERIQTAKVEAVPEAAPEQEAIDLADIQTASTEAPAVKPGEETLVKLSNNVMVVTGAHQRLEKAPIPAVTEGRAEGPLPRISSRGKKPSDLYARPTSMNAIYGDQARIVLILGGMGLNEKLTKQASNDLPGEVTFAFAPYGNNLQAQVDLARQRGHEVLLQLPMEPVGYPATNPGPKTLLADGSAADNEQNLYWHMSRFLGYTGIINYMGGRFLSAPEAIRPLLTELKKRGLNFMEDGSLPLTATDQAASRLNMPIRHGDGVIDINPDAKSITAALTALEEQAKNGGIAIGTGSGLDVTIETVKAWMEEAQQRGVVIVPASAAFKGTPG